MEAVLLAIIVAVGALLSAGLNAWIARKSKEHDYARQDEVAAQAAEAAKLLLAANERVAKQTTEVFRVTSGKLDQIHELVNSNMTASIEDQLTANEQLLAVLKEMALLRGDVSPEARRTIAAAETRVSELRTRVADRLHATKVADKQAEKAAQ